MYYIFVICIGLQLHQGVQGQFMANSSLLSNKLVLNRTDLNGNENVLTTIVGLTAKDTATTQTSITKQTNEEQTTQKVDQLTTPIPPVTNIQYQVPKTLILEEATPEPLLEKKTVSVGRKGVEAAPPSGGTQSESMMNQNIPSASNELLRMNSSVIHLLTTPKTVKTSDDSSETDDDSNILSKSEESHEDNDDSEEMQGTVNEKLNLATTSTNLPVKKLYPMIVENGTVASVSSERVPLHKPATASSNSEVMSSGSTMVILILIVLVCCSFAGIAYFKLVRKGMNRRHYERVDFLIDGMYDDDL